MASRDVEQKCTYLAELIDKSNRIVFFGGAGVSTESGIPDFRSRDGLYNQKYKFPPEMILSHTFFKKNPEEFYRFYRDKLIVDGVKPNLTHNFLAWLEKKGKLLGVVTQNIDGLHQAAGSRVVAELHGSLLRNYCTRCRKPHPLSYVTGSVGVPYCSCGGIIRPDVVLYEEGLDDEVVENAAELISSADLLIIAGTSLTVYPAAGFVRLFRGNACVLINRDPTPYDYIAELVINRSMGEIFQNVRDKLLYKEPKGERK